jgi:hypothetical protein
MKLFVILLFLVLFTWNDCKLAKQSIHIGNNKLQINDNKNEVLIINSETKENKKSNQENKNTVLEVNFNSKLKQAEEDLYNNLSKRDINNSGKMKRLTQIQIRNSTLNNTNSSTQKKELYSEQIIPVYKISSLTTSITINNMKTSGEINEKVKFLLKDGTFSSLIRKISLAGSSDSAVVFKLTSNDVKLKEARIINNCFEEGKTARFRPYICVIAIFEDIDARSNPQGINVEIEYEYTAQNILRIDQNETSNQIIWVYDNMKRIHEIQNVNLEVKFYNNTQLGEKSLVKSNLEKFELDYNIKTLTSRVRFYVDRVRENDEQEISIAVPLFNTRSRKIVCISI